MMFPEGSMAGFSWNEDPRRFAFTCARYKVVAKMVEGLDRVLEVGCNDGFFSRIVRQHVHHLTAMDSDPQAIALAQSMNGSTWNVHFEWGSILDPPRERSRKTRREDRGAGPYLRRRPDFDAVYCLDVFEHILDENALLTNLACAAPMGIIGTPSLESQVYASPVSKEAHVHCVTKSQLRASMKQHWKHVVVLGMNDETLHCGFDAMTHYLIGLGFK